MNIRIEKCNEQKRTYEDIGIFSIDKMVPEKDWMTGKEHLNLLIDEVKK